MSQFKITLFYKVLFETVVTNSLLYSLRMMIARIAFLHAIVIISQALQVNSEFTQSQELIIAAANGNNEKVRLDCSLRSGDTLLTS